MAADRHSSAAPGLQLLGAGNANLVFSVHDDHNAELAGTVLRVRKKPNWEGGASKVKKPTGGQAGPSWADKADTLIWADILPPGTDSDGDTSAREEHYMLTYLTQWLNDKYIPRGVPCELPAAMLPALSDFAAVLDLAVPPQLCVDHTVFAGGPPAGWQVVGPALCAEIKPKAGCMPSLTYVSAANAPLKARFPRYVMHALLKAVKGAGQLNTYNPVDLLSAQPARVTRALHALMAAPNNNLRLFVGGRQVWGDPADAKAASDKHHSSSLASQAQPPQPTSHSHSLADAAVTSPSVPASGVGPSLMGPAAVQTTLQALDSVLEQSGFGAVTATDAAAIADSGAAGNGGSCMAAAGSCGEPADRLCPHVGMVTDALQQVLVREELLPQLLAVQQQDTLDVEGAAAAYAALTAYWAQQQQQQAPATAAADAAPVSSGAPPANGSAASTQPPTSSSAAASQLPQVWAGHTEPEVLQLLRGYLTATTAKDCGVMVTLQGLVADPTTTAAAGQAAGTVAAVGAAGEQDAAAGADQPSRTTSWVPGMPSPSKVVYSLQQAAQVLGSMGRRNRGVVSVRHPSGAVLHFMYKITLLDLDLKSCSKIPTHARQDADILTCAAQHLPLLQQWERVVSAPAQQ